MKTFFCFFASVLILGCSTKKNSAIEQDIFIASLGQDFDSNGKFIQKNTAGTIHLSRDFWDYFIRTHPKTSSMIFISPLYDTSNNLLILDDTSFTSYTVAHTNSYYFTKLLADSVNSKEKEYSNISAFFVNIDTADNFEREKRIEEKMKDYKITPTIKNEFMRLKNILTWTDTTHQYVIVFKKKFADKIYKLYE